MIRGPSEYDQIVIAFVRALRTIAGPVSGSYCSTSICDLIAPPAADRGAIGPDDRRQAIRRRDGDKI